MDYRKLSNLVSKLIADRNFQEAEQALVEAKHRAETENDNETLHFVLSELIELNGMLQPPLWDKAESLSQEREKLISSAYSKLQTAMILYHGVNDYGRAIRKLGQAIQQGKDELDDKTVYTALSLLGEASLKLGRADKAVEVLSQLEEMAANKMSFVAGDETCFLEALRARHLESDRVARLASILASVCRDTAFKDRLTVLASGA